MVKVLFATLPTKGGSVHEEYIAQLSAVAEYSKANEPGVLIYAVCVPRDETDIKTVYMLEVYKDQAALDAHMNADIVKALIKWCEDNVPLDGTPSVLMLDVVESIGLLSRAVALEAAADPFLVVGEVSYKEAALAEKSLAYWAKVFASSRDDEPGTYLYALLQDASEASKIVTLEAYESAEYLTATHVKSEAVAVNVKETQPWRTALKHSKMRRIHGFLARV